MTGFKWKIDKYNFLLIANITTYLLISIFLIHKSMFDGGVDDGFYRQMEYVVDSGGWSTSPLSLVHLLRFIIISPFYFLYANGYSSIFEAILVLIFLMPILTIKFGKKRPYTTAFLVFLPLLFSYRTVLVMCAIAYLFICLYDRKKRYALFSLSMLLANLSSGVILPWVLIVFMNISNLASRYKFIRLLSVVAAIVLSYSVFQKYDFFFGEYSVSESLIERSTFYVSIINEQYFRFFAYIALFIAWIVISLAKINSKSFSMGLYSFYLPMFMTLFFEGLGLISFLIPVIWFYVGIRPLPHVYGLERNYHAS